MRTRINQMMRDANSNSQNSAIFAELEMILLSFEFILDCAVQRNAWDRTTVQWSGTPGIEPLCSGAERLGSNHSAVERNAWDRTTVQWSGTPGIEPLCNGAERQEHDFQLHELQFERCKANSRG